ncbi:hypothetical protein AALT52_07135 [Ligilactobacillus faecis]|uniref:Uncharacterized protein n=1 Tax=Ligilactobacillus faecis TaxID=762833 RepID=A0ABV4DTD7_9LACO
MNVMGIEDLDFTNVDNNLKHLTKNQVLEVINKYYDGVNIDKILEDYKINVAPTRLVRIFPRLFIDKVCEKCSERLVVEFKSKSISKPIDLTKAYCPSCGHQENAYCTCSYCKTERQEAEEAREQRLKTRIENLVHKIVQEESLSQKDKLYLSVVLRVAMSEDIGIIEPISKLERKLTPSEEWTVELMKTLITRDLISVSAESDLDVFTEEKDFLSYPVLDVKYNINIEPYDGNYENMIRRLIYPDPEQFEADFCYDMWKKVALSESEEYLLFEMNKVRYNFSPGKKTYMVLESLTEHFSTGQIYNIIYRSVANSTKRYQSGEITKKHAQNLVISFCEHMGERAVAENWNMVSYGRRYDLPESVISEVLFNSIMQISSLGFSEKPTRDFR